MITQAFLFNFKFYTDIKKEELFTDEFLKSRYNSLSSLKHHFLLLFSVSIDNNFTAVIFQHEIDHLNGILYLDHLEKELKEAKHN